MHTTPSSPVSRRAEGDKVGMGQPEFKPAISRWPPRRW